MPGLITQFNKSKLQTKIFVLMGAAYMIVIAYTTIYPYLRVNYMAIKEEKERQVIEQIDNK